MCIYSCGIVTSERILPHYRHEISEGPSWNNDNNWSAGMHYHRVIGDIVVGRVFPAYSPDPFRIKSSLHDGSLKYDDDGDMRKQKGNQATYWNKASKGDTGTRVLSFLAGIADEYFPVSRNAESMCISQHSPSDRGDVEYNLIETTGPLLFGMITVQNPVESYSHSL
ncbi:hypothetical protein ARMGADRAFT_1036854 [Armillaria gallica]|uniref:Uncharacterized protein n=1 Tax=Armillaria gallica TaxID=47427 RepID=A0A2H3CU10_ARMGA|nr:hypothetical protein ARMGADRAFT_1036854 [Armillaria gallica]